LYELACRYDMYCVTEGVTVGTYYHTRKNLNTRRQSVVNYVSVRITVRQIVMPLADNIKKLHICGKKEIWILAQDNAVKKVCVLHAVQMIC
jgi:hypothetical protein